MALGYGGVTEVASVDAHGYDVVLAILLLQFFDHGGGVGAVHAALSGEVLYEHMLFTSAGFT